MQDIEHAGFLAAAADDTGAARPEIQWYQGGHTGFFRSQPVQRFIDDALVQSGLVDPSRMHKR